MSGVLKLAANIGRVAVDLGECSFGKVWSVIWAASIRC